MNYQEQLAAYNTALANATQGDVDAALDAMETKFDNGNLIPLFIAKDENVQHQVRILPNLTTPSAWWMSADIYDYHPSCLKAGMAPRGAQADRFATWLRGVVPYDKDNPCPVQKAFSGNWPSARALSLVLVRTQHKDIDNSKLHVWSMPIKKGGFKHAIEPTIRQWGMAMMQNIDIYTGREATFMVIGKMFDRSLANFNWAGDPCPIGDTNFIAHLFDTQYVPLEETFRQLTDEDMQAYIDYYAPIAEAFNENPQLAVQFTSGPKARGAKDPQARVVAVQYLNQKTTVAVNPGMAAAQGAVAAQTQFVQPTPVQPAQNPAMAPAPSGAMAPPNVPQLPMGVPPAVPGAMAPPMGIPQQPAQAVPPMGMPVQAAPPMGVPPLTSPPMGVPAAPPMAAAPPQPQTPQTQMAAPMAAPMPQQLPQQPPPQLTAPSGVPPAPPLAPMPTHPAGPSGPPMPMPASPPPPQ